MADELDDNPIASTDTTANSKPSPAAKYKAMVRKPASKVTKLFPATDQPDLKKKKTIDSLNKLGYQADPNSVHRVDGTNYNSVTFLKPNN